MIKRQSINVRGLFVVVLLACGALALPSSAQDVSQLTTAGIYRKATELLSSGQYGAAMPYLQELIQRLSRIRDDAQAAGTLEWARYFSGVCNVETGQYDEAIKIFKGYLRDYPNGQFRKNAYLMIPESMIAKGEWEQAIEPLKDAIKNAGLERDLLIGAYYLLGEAYFRLEKWKEAYEPIMVVYQQTQKTEQRTRAAVMATICLIKLEDFKRLFEFLPIVYKTPARFDPGLNLTLIEGGDKNYEDQKFEPALLLYRFVYPKAVIELEIAVQIANTKAIIEALGQQSGFDTASRKSMKLGLERRLKDLEEQKDRLSKIPDYDQALRIRIAQTYVELRRHWEGLVIFRSVYDEFPEHPLADQALYSAFWTALQMKEIERSFVEGYEYVKAFPKGKFWDSVTVTLTQLHIERKEWRKAMAIAVKGLEVNPEHSARDQLTYLIGYCHFNEEEFDQALERFAEVKSRFPDSVFYESAFYWHALTALYLARYPTARAEFAEFRQKWPTSQYIEDATYRLGVAQYGDGDFKAAADTFREFLDRFPNSQMRSEAFAMVGDILAFESDLDNAIDYYAKAREAAINMPQYNYATFQSARVMELERKYDLIINLFREYLAKWGEKGNYSEAAYWIGTAQMRSEQPREALQTFFDTIVKYGDTPTAYGVDMIIRDLISELDQRVSKEEQIRFHDQLYKELENVRAAKRKVLELRLIAFFAERMQDADVRNSMVASLLQDWNIKDGSPIVLLMMGRYGAQLGKKDFARKVYDHFLKTYSDSDLVMEAVKATAELKIVEGKYDEALPLLKDLTERFAMFSEAAWAQKTLGDVYRLQKRPEDAIKTYSLVLGVKEWRGPLWPEALYWIGICHLEQGTPREAFAFFQRIYVLYEAYPAWVAKAYLKSAECLERLDQKADAVKTLQEMLSKESLAQLPETKEAQAMLQRLTGVARE